MNLHVTANPSISTKLLIPQSNQGVIERVIGHRGMRFVADCERYWVNMSDMTGTSAGPCPFPPFRHSLHYHGLDGLAGAVHQNNIRTTYQSGGSQPVHSAADLQTISECLISHLRIRTYPPHPSHEMARRSLLEGDQHTCHLPHTPEPDIGSRSVHCSNTNADSASCPRTNSVPCRP